MNVFDIIGPIMVGPSSSHTAGAARIGKMARRLLGDDLQEAQIQFHGSFAHTYKGHGTDRAIVGGLLGFEPDDLRIKTSLEIAAGLGLRIVFEKVHLREAHPNTVVIKMRDKSGKALSVTGSSIGGGNIVIKQIDDLKVEIYGEYHTLAVVHQDTPGMVAKVTGLLAKNSMNIARMNLFRSRRGGEALMIIELDQRVPPRAIKSIANLECVISVRHLEPTKRLGGE